MDALFALLLLASAPPPAADSLIDWVLEVGEDRAVTDPDSPSPWVEPHLAAHPDSAAHLVAAAMEVPADGPGGARCATFSSFDAGASWERHDLPILGCVDPWVAITPAGVAVVAVLGTDGSGARGLHVFRSADGGRSWPAGAVFLGDGHDHPTMTLSSDESSRSRIYLTTGRRTADENDRSWSSVYVAQSADGAASFDTTAELTPSNLNLEPLTSVVLSDGGLVVPFMDHSTMGGRRLERRRVWLVESEDGDRRFSAPRFVSESCSRSRPTSWASMAIDASEGPFGDRLYFVCERDGYDGIQVSRSDDRGMLWAEPLRADSGLAAAYTRTPSIAVGPSGVLGVSWYDRGHDPERECQKILFTASLDGGETFLDPVEVSTVASCPDTEQNGFTAVRWGAGGDYSGLAASTDGAFHVFWADSRTGVFGLRTATVRVTPGGLGP